MNACKESLPIGPRGNDSKLQFGHSLAMQIARDLKADLAARQSESLFRFAGIVGRKRRDTLYLNQKLTAAAQWMNGDDRKVFQSDLGQ